MSEGLEPLLEVLERARQPVDCFIRDDDGGWDNERQIALLDATAAAAVPIDLAVIPMALDGALARELIRRIDGGMQPLGVHQHGLSHTDHQTETGGRKCEFGPAREPELQRLDLSNGWNQLLRQFGPRLDPIFTPPWNRCAAETPHVLSGLGYAALSRSRGATAQQVLPELPVDLDWCKQHRAGGPEAIVHAWSRDLAARIDDGLPFGLMLHHAAMEAAEFDLLRSWLLELAHHPLLRWRSMRSLLAEQRVRTCATA